MRTKRATAILISVFMCIVFTSYAAKAKRGLKDLKAIYDNNIAQMEKEYAEKSVNWPHKYTKSLEALLKKMQLSGDLDGWQAVNNELKRFRKSKTLTSDDISSDYASLRALQLDVEKISSAIELEKSEDVIGLTELYVHHLTKLQKSLTISGKINDALEIKAEIARVQSSSKMSAAEFTIAEDEAKQSVEQRAEAAAVEVKPAEQPTTEQPAATPPAVKADSSSVSIEDMKTWKTLFIEARKASYAYYQMKKDDKRRDELKKIKEAKKSKWNAVKDQYYSGLGHINATDTAEVKRLKQARMDAYKRKDSA